MKKNLFLGFIAFAALTMTSCSKDESLVNNRADNAIEFGTYLGRDAQTRASVLDKTGLQSDGFGVFAYYTDNADYNPASSTANFMYNTKVSTADWTYSPIKYWPNDPGDKLTFFAYAPYDDSDKTAEQGKVDNISFSAQDSMSGDPVITFNVNNTVKDQTDLLFSKSNTKDLVKNKAGNDGIYVDEKVEFQFAHALSRIGFTVKAVVDEVASSNPAKKLDASTTIVLKKVILSGAAGDGNNAPTAPTTGLFYTQGNLNINQQDVNTLDAYNQVAWTDIIGDAADEDKQIFTLTNENFAAQTQGTESGYFKQGFILTEDTKILDVANSTTANKLNADDSYIMIIPQDLSSGGFYVYVEYDVITIDTNIGNNSNTYEGLKSKITNHISTKVSGINFQSGKAYTLNLQLGMTSVKVDADVDPWSEVGGTVVDLPQNTQQANNN